MASAKKMKAVAALLDRLGEDVVLDYRATGASVRALCEHFDITTRPLYGWLGNTTTARRGERSDGTCRRERWIEATAMGADSRASLADERLEVLLDPETKRMRADVTREEVALAKALADQDRWQAGNLDPKQFRQNQPAESGTPAISVGSMFVNILSKVSAEHSQTLPGEATVVGSVQVKQLSASKPPVPAAADDNDDDYDLDDDE